MSPQISKTHPEGQSLTFFDKLSGLNVGNSYVAMCVDYVLY